MADNSPEQSCICASGTCLAVYRAPLEKIESSASGSGEAGLDFTMAWVRHRDGYEDQASFSSPG